MSVLTRRWRRRPRLVALAAVAGVALSLSGCAGSHDGESSGGADTLTVFAAASLKDSFSEIAQEFENQHPDVDVRLSFAGSSDLATQIIAGAPADVFAAADEPTLARVGDEGLLAGEPEIFATNTLMIAVPTANPAGIESFADLAAPGVDTVVCAPQVPCGAAAQRLEELTGTSLTPVSEESSVTDVLGKVTTGQADAGLVYVTDVASAKDEVKGLPIPQAGKAMNRYPIAVVDGGHEELARAFVGFVTSESGQRILKTYEFGLPRGGTE